MEFEWTALAGRLQDAFPENLKSPAACRHHASAAQPQSHANRLYQKLNRVGTPSTALKVPGGNCWCISSGDNSSLNMPYASLHRRPTRHLKAWFQFVAGIGRCSG